MEILLTGYTAFLTQEWIETAFPDDHVLTTHTKGEALLDTRVKTVTLDGKQLLAQINETYQFDRIVYFSEYLLPHGEQEGEQRGAGHYEAVGPFERAQRVAEHDEGMQLFAVLLHEEGYGEQKDKEGEEGDDASYGNYDSGHYLEEEGG